MSGNGKLRVAIAGAGMVAHHHLEGWMGSPYIQLCAVCDTDLSKASALALKGGGVAVYTDLEAMLLQERPDILDIALPAGVHGMAIAAGARYGAAILCQKPLAPTLAEAEAIVGSLPRGVRLMVHENWRFRASYRRIYQWLDTGAFGRPLMFDMKVMSSGLVERDTGKYPALERQPFLRKLERFIVLEVLIHHLDTLAFLFGPLKVHGALSSRTCHAVKGEDMALILLEAGGIPGTLAASFTVTEKDTVPQDELTIVTERGSILLEGWGLQSTLPDFHAQSWEPHVAYQQSYSDTIGHFVECLQSGEPFETGFEAGLASLQAVEDIYALAAR